MIQKCVNHPDKCALSFCHVCKKHFCSDCLVLGREYYYCNHDIPKEEFENDKSVQDESPTNLISASTAREEVSIFVPSCILLIIIIIIFLSHFMALLLPLGIPIAVYKTTNNSFLAAISGIASCLLLIIFLFAMFLKRDKSTFYKTVFCLIALLFLNFKGCSSMGRFIDG